MGCFEFGWNWIDIYSIYLRGFWKLLVWTLTLYIFGLGTPFACHSSIHLLSGHQDHHFRYKRFPCAWSATSIWGVTFTILCQIVHMEEARVYTVCQWLITLRKASPCILLCKETASICLTARAPRSWIRQFRTGYFSQEMVKVLKGSGLVAIDSSLVLARQLSK